MTEREIIELLYKNLKDTTTPEEYEHIIADETAKLIESNKHPHIRIKNSDFVAKTITEYEQHLISFTRLLSVILETTYDAMNDLNDDLYNRYRFYLYAEPDVYYNGEKYPRIQRQNESIFVEFRGDSYDDQRFNNPNMSLMQTISANRFLNATIDEYERNNQ